MKKNNQTTPVKKWFRKPQECDGTYQFDGSWIATRTISESLSTEEFFQILGKVFKYVTQNNGADYLFVFTNKNSNKRIFVIDNLNKEMKENSSEEFIRENNYFTIMFAEEY